VCYLPGEPPDGNCDARPGACGTLAGQPLQPKVHTISFDAAAAEKGEYQHFMQKEIHEQVRSLTDTLAGRVDFQAGRIRLPELKLDA